MGPLPTGLDLIVPGYSTEMKSGLVSCLAPLLDCFDDRGFLHAKNLTEQFDHILLLVAMCP